MSIVVNGRVLCGKPTRRGTPCQTPLRGGKCITHDSDLSARNSAAAQSAQRNNPDAFRSQRTHAGKLGKAVTGIAQWAFATEQARLWRIAHPSKPEQRVAEILAKHLDLNVDYDREYVIAGDPRAVDFAFPAQQLAIEVWGHQNAPAFGETASRLSRAQAKLAWLAALGWNVHVVDASPSADPSAEQTRLLAFLAQHNLLDSRTLS